MPSRFVRPDNVILKISDGDTLTVRRRLNAGQQRELYLQMYATDDHGRLRVRPLSSGLALVCAYLLDWSLTDERGQRVMIVDVSVEELTAHLNALSYEDFTEIKEAIETHEAAMLAARAEEKKSQGGAIGSSPISPSPSAAGGVMSGSPSWTPTSAPSSSTS